MLIKGPDTAHARFKDAGREYQGRARGRTGGSWVADLVALQKMVCLCAACRPKFDEARSGYYETKREPFKNGAFADCDGCKTQRADCQVFLPEGRR